MIIKILFPARQNTAIDYDDCTTGPFGDYPGIKLKIPGVQFRAGELLNLRGKGPTIYRARVTDYSDDSVGILVTPKTEGTFVGRDPGDFLYLEPVLAVLEAKK